MGSRKVWTAIAVFLALSTAASASAQIINVPAGGNLQSAIDQAQPGATILLAPGATYVGDFVLPAKGGTAPITIRSAAPDGAFPPAGTRISPAYAGNLPKIRAVNGSGPAIATAPRASNWVLRFLEFTRNPGGTGAMIALGSDGASQSSLDTVPQNITIDRCYIHGEPGQAQLRGIALNSGATTIRDSYISEIKAVGADSQAIGGWSGPGPYRIVNNYLEAAGENILIGGSSMQIPNVTPTDIEIRNNHLIKPESWRNESWSVKNLLELKHARHVTIEGNLLEHNWQAAQPGYAVLFTPRNQYGDNPWTVVEDVTFTGNIVRQVSAVFNILGYDDNYPSRQTNRITIHDNVFEDVSGNNWGGTGRFMLINEAAAITVDHNTVFNGGNAIYAYGAASPSFAFTNNIASTAVYGIMGDAIGEGNTAVSAYFPGSTIAGNLLVSCSNSSNYPAGNNYPSNYVAVGFANQAAGDYRLSAGSAYRGRATDGSDPGVNIDHLNAFLAGSGGTVPPPQPPPPQPPPPQPPPPQPPPSEPPPPATPPSAPAAAEVFLEGEHVVRLAGSWAGRTAGARAGDFNGDGITDLFLYDSQSGGWYMSLNDGSGALTHHSGTWSPGWQLEVLDFDADGRSDIFVYNPQNGLWFQCLTRGAGEFEYHPGRWSPGWSIYPADFDGNGRGDIFVYDRAKGLWFECLNNGSGGFTYAGGQWSPGWTVNVFDWTGDRRSDVFVYNKQNGLRYSCANTGAGQFNCGTLGSWSPGWEVRHGDIDDDGRGDLFVYDPVTGNWFACRMWSDGTFAYVGGRWDPGYEFAFRDVNDDRRADVLLYNPRTGYYFLCATTSPGGFTYYRENVGGGWGLVPR